MFDQIRVQLRPSFAVSALLAVPLGASIVLLLSLALPNWLSGALVAVNLALISHYLSLLGQLSRPSSIIQLRVSEREIVLYDADGSVINATLNQRSLVSRWLCILSFDCLSAETSGIWPFSAVFSRSRTVILCQYNVTNREDLRRLRVLLNYGNFNQTDTISLQ